MAHHDACVQANFNSEAQYQQHVAGPVHQKALKKQQDELLRSQRMAMCVASCPL